MGLSQSVAIYRESPQLKANGSLPTSPPPPPVEEHCLFFGSLLRRGLRELVGFSWVCRSVLDPGRLIFVNLCHLEAMNRPKGDDRADFQSHLEDVCGVHVKSDRNSCVKNENRAQREVPTRLLSLFHTVDQSLREVEMTVGALTVERRFQEL